jgi:hypothetical protein
MKYLIRISSISLLLAAILAGSELPSDVQNLITKRDEAIEKIDVTFVRELEKLKIKYTKLGDLDSANRIVDLIAKHPIKSSDASDHEFDGTTWEFLNKSGRLGLLEFLAGGKVKSKEYPNSSWQRVDKDTIRFQYEKNQASGIAGGHVIFRFQDANRSKMSGIQSELGTIRYLHKVAK